MVFSSRHLLALALPFSLMVHFGVGSPNTSVPAAKSFGALAQGFYIPEINLLTDELHAVGSKIFHSLPSHCVVSDNVGRTQKESTFYSNTASLYNTFSVSFGIGASLKGAYTLGASLAAVTNNIVAGNKNVSGLSLNLVEHSKDYSLKMDCVYKQPLDKDFIQDFEGLDSEVNKPWLARSWYKYRIFLQKYGSHVVKKVTSGASIIQYVFADSSKGYSKRDYEVKACLSLSNNVTEVNNGTAGGKPCAGISKSEANSAGSISTVEKLVIRGGTPKTRAQLTNESPDNPSKETISSFLQEGLTNPSPIMYKFIGIWDILKPVKPRYVGKPGMAKVRNLEQFFKGFKNFDCAYKQTSNNQVLQKFVLSEDSDPNLPTYKCMLAPFGCHDNKDCHYKHPFWCACAGESCVAYKSATLNSGTTKTEAYAYTSVSPGWKGQGCKLSGFKCKCKKERTNWSVSWSGDTAGRGLRDMHHALAKGRIRIMKGKKKPTKKTPN